MSLPSSGSDILDRWRRLAAAEPESVGQLLRLVRAHTGQDATGQGAAIGADLAQLERLMAFRAPRPDRFAADAYAIAEACGLPQPVLLVSQLLLARGLAQGAADASTPAYLAALDAEAAEDDGVEADDDDADR